MNRENPTYDRGTPSGSRATAVTSMQAPLDEFYCVKSVENLDKAAHEFRVAADKLDEIARRDAKIQLRKAL